MIGYDKSSETFILSFCIFGKTLDIVWNPAKTSHAPLQVIQQGDVGVFKTLKEQVINFRRIQLRQTVYLSSVNGVFTDGRLPLPVFAYAVLVGLS